MVSMKQTLFLVLINQFDKDLLPVKIFLKRGLTVLTQISRSKHVK